MRRFGTAITTEKGVNDFPFKINEYEFSETRDIANKKVMKINITEYLKEGKNIINFNSLNYNDSDKYIIYRVEFDNE